MNNISIDSYHVVLFFLHSAFIVTIIDYLVQFMKMSWLFMNPAYLQCNYIRKAICMYCIQYTDKLF